MIALSDSLATVRWKLWEKKEGQPPLHTSRFSVQQRLCWSLSISTKRERERKMVLGKDLLWTTGLNTKGEGEGDGQPDTHNCDIASRWFALTIKGETAFAQLWWSSGELGFLHTTHKLSRDTYFFFFGGIEIRILRHGVRHFPPIFMPRFSPNLKQWHGRKQLWQAWRTRALREKHIGSFQSLDYSIT